MITLDGCPLCGGKWQSITAPPVAIGHDVFTDSFGLARCRECSVRFVNPRPTDDNLDRFYSADGYECHTSQKASDPVIRLQIVERFKSPTTLCDFGCGAGELLRSAEGRGWEVTGVEPGATRDRLTAQGFQVVSDINEIPPVDAVVMVHSLEHCPDPSNVLSDLRKKINQGGLIYIEVPNADSLRARLANSFLKPFWTFAAERYLAFPIHLFYFNPHSLTRLLKNQGYQILELGTMGMGVEELFTPKANGNESSAAASSTALSSTASARPRFQFAKNIIKSGVYRSHLGENLYVIATVS